MDSKNNLNVTIRDSCYIPNNPFSTNLPVERISISKSSTEGTVSYEMENHLDQAVVAVFFPVIRAISLAWS